MNRNYRLPVLLLAVTILPLLVSLACNLGVSPATPTPAVSPTSSQKPVITIKSPLNNADAVVNQKITVEVASSHPDGVTRVELRANSLQIDSKVSQNPLGDQQFSAFMDYTPSAVGTVTLQAIAYRGVLASDPATITLNVKAAESQVEPTAAIVPTIDNDPTCRARIDVSGLNFRQGPGTNYTVITIFGLGTVVRLTGRLADNTWWQGAYNNQFGWLSANYITLLGFCSGIPVAQPPAPPSPTATNTSAPQPQVSVTPGQPDLVVTDFTGPIQIMLSQAGTATGTYRITVQNAGPVQAGQFSVGVTLPDGTLRNVGTVPTLAPGQLAILQTDVTLNAPGTARLIAIADSANQIGEANKNNNLRVLDLVIIKPTAQPGPTATITATTAASPTATSTVAATATPTSTVAATSTPTATATSTATSTTAP